MKLPLCHTQIKSRIARLLLLGIYALTFGLATARAETPTEAVDRVWTSYAHLDPHRGSENFPVEFWRLSKKVAKEQGLAVIPLIMARAKDWQGEEELVFVMLMISLPPQQAISVLEKYKKKGKPWEQQAATDFLIEIDEFPKELAEMPKAQREKWLKDTAL